MPTKLLIFCAIFPLMIISCNSQNSTKTKNNSQILTDSLQKITITTDTLPKKRDLSHLDTMEVSPDFVERLPTIDAQNWLHKRQFKGSFSVDSAMHLIFEKNYFHFPFDDSGYESETEVLDVAVWKSQNFPLKTFYNDWVGDYDSFPNPSYKVNDTRVNGDTIFELNGKNYAIISTSTLPCQFPSFNNRVGRFSPAFLGIALFEQKKETKNNIPSISHSDIWEFQFYNPAIGAYGSYSTAPKPKIYQIGKNKLGVIVTDANGGAGGPFYGDLFIHSLDKKSSLLFSEHFFNRKYGEKSSWYTTINFENTGNQEFADLVLTTEGHFLKESFTEIDEDINQVNFPKTLQKKIKTEDNFDFKVKRTYRYQKGKYQLINEVLM